MKNFLLILLLLPCTFAKAQYVVNYKKVADTYFENKDYYAASTFYKKALKITSDSTQVIIPYSKDKKYIKDDKVTSDYEEAIYKLAESSRMYREYADAEKYYGIATTFSNVKYNKAMYYYGESLMANKNFSQAIDAFEKFINKSNDSQLADKAKSKILSCRFAINEMRYPRLIQLTKVAKNVNALGSNYAPVQYHNEFYFTSSRPVSVGGKRDFLKVGSNEIQVSTKANPFLNAVYLVKDPLSAAEVSVKKIDLPLPKATEFATLAINPKGDVVYFTAWKDNEKYAIYSAKKNGEGWSNPQPLSLQINSKDYNTIQPFVTADGKFMFFSSDRPGGYGKYDLWYSVIREDGTFGQPVNLGPEINTEGDEKAPYYNTITKKLLFSSDGRIGLGGLDFFESEGDLVSWTRPSNMGYPFNSSKDDIYFTAVNDLGTEGYISSDRESSCCLEVFSIKREFLTITGRILDCKTKQPLQNASVSLMGTNGEQKIKTNGNGIYKFVVDSRRPVKLVFGKDNYFSINKNYAYEELAKADTLLNKEFCMLPFKVNTPIVLENVYYEFNSAALTEPSKQVLNSLVTIMEDNPEMEIELGAHTDGIGTEEYNLDLSNKRAESCVQYLISKNIAPSRLAAKGYGKNMPIAPNTLKNGNDNPEGRAKNRRTEFKVTKK